MENDQSDTGLVEDIRGKILDGFKLYVLEHGQIPPSVYKLAKLLNIQEAEFYTHFSSLGALQSALWVESFDRTLVNLYAQEIYGGYSAREKLLAFFFTWIEELKKDRSYLLVLYDQSHPMSKLPPPEVGQFKEKFKDFAKSVLMEGKETEEIAKRPFISDRYDEGLWLQVWFIFRFWIKDSSTSFEKTDVAIEKSVHLAFDLMGKSPLDSMVDFAKFLFQNK
jgi:AcrR family transcriptional regulator